MRLNLVRNLVRNLTLILTRNLMRLNLVSVSDILILMKKPQFINEYFYHVYNRGVEKRNIFLDKKDYFRFTHDLFEFNDEAAAQNIYYKLPSLKSYEVQPRKVSKRKILVEIIAFCLMPNHFHLLLRQKVDNGIVKFMQKLGTGYTMYFNQKYQRVGGLFQGRFKAVLIEKESHFLYLPHYIHLNPLDLHIPSWRDKKITNMQSAINFLESYRWSSYLDHIGKKNFPSIISTNLFKKLYGTPKEYRESLREWLNDMDLADLFKVVIE